MKNACGLSRFEKGFRYGFLLAAVAACPVLSSSCSAVADAQKDLCCIEYQPGGDMLHTDFRVDASIKASFTAFAQAAGDVATVGAQAVADVTGACLAIATDLGAATDDPAAANLGGTALMNFWCGKATAQISATMTATVGANAKLAVQYEPPKCSASMSAQANCQGSCDVSGKCDIKANPPKCTGGTLQIECKGGCSGSVDAPKIECTGSCSGKCEGSCEAQGGVAVDCNGTCDGTCSAGGSASGSGVQADGSCKGTCQGKCTMSATAPSVSCSGTCSGKCDAKCTASPGQASVKCSGSCDADYQPLECTGGKLEGGCQVEANCQASCNAHAQASASCTEPKLSVGFTGTVAATAQVQYNALVRTLETNLPRLLVVLEGRGASFTESISGLVSVGGSLVASGKLDAHALGCANFIGTSVQGGIDNFKAALTQSASVVATVK